MGAGGSSSGAFAARSRCCRTALSGGRPRAWPPSRSQSGCSCPCTSAQDAAQAEVHRWFSGVYHNPDRAAREAGVFGTPEQVREQLEALVSQGATHLLLNPVARYAEQVEALAEVVGLA